MSELGYLVVGGIRVPVTGIELKGGQIVITARRKGPLARMRDGSVTIFGSDGQGILQNPDEVASWPRIWGDQTLTLTQCLVAWTVEHVPA